MLSSLLSRRLLIPLRTYESRISTSLLHKEYSQCSMIKQTHLTTARLFSSDDLPYHLVVGMPALSPTMESGTIASWNVEEGDSIAAGDTIAEIETDKATISFEAQDDAYVAKILVKSGTTDITVGDPIMVTVEDEDHIAAFKDYVLPEGGAKRAAPVVETPPPKVEIPPQPVVAAAPKVETPPPQLVAPPTPASLPPPSPASIPETVVPTTMAPVWGEPVKVKSPLAGRLSKIQKDYVELYGSTGQIPIE